jgi:hypothetical protein
VPPPMYLAVPVAMCDWVHVKAMQIGDVVRRSLF